jgi:hypothetical protein
MRLVNGYFLSSIAHPLGELIGPRAPPAPNAGVEAWLAEVVADIPELVPELALETWVGGFARVVVGGGDGEALAWLGW